MKLMSVLGSIHNSASYSKVFFILKNKNASKYRRMYISSAGTRTTEVITGCDLSCKN